MLDDARVDPTRATVDAGESVDLSVVIACFNGASTLGAQLEALLAQVAPVAWEIVVADNGSTDTSRELVAGFAASDRRIRLVDASDRQGVAHARNVGAEHSRGASVSFCDQDDQVARGWLAAMAQALEHHEFVAGVLEHDRLNPDWVLAARGRPQVDQLLTVDYGGWPPFGFGCTLGVRKTLHQSVGGFDELFARGGEDADYCWRLRELGIELVLVPEAVTHYRFRHSLRGLYRQARSYGGSEVLVYAKHRGLGIPKLAHPCRRALGLWAHTAGSFVRARTKVELAAAVWSLGERVGRLGASIKCGVLFP